MEKLRTSLNNSATYVKLSANIANIASQLQLNLNQLRAKNFNNVLHKSNDTSETVCPCTQHSTEADDPRASQRTTARTANRPTALSGQEPVLQRIPSNADANVAEVTNPSHPTVTDEDGDEAQEFYIEFGGKMFQHNPKILTVE